MRDKIISHYKKQFDLDDLNGRNKQTIDWAEVLIEELFGDIQQAKGIIICGSGMDTEKIKAALSVIKNDIPLVHIGEKPEALTGMKDSIEIIPDPIDSYAAYNAKSKKKGHERPYKFHP